jgi:hypothetical protein
MPSDFLYIFSLSKPLDSEVVCFLVTFYKIQLVRGKTSTFTASGMFLLLGVSLCGSVDDLFIPSRVPPLYCSLKDGNIPESSGDN